MKMDLQKHIDEYKTLAERVEQTIANEKKMLETFSCDVTLARILTGEIDIFQNILIIVNSTINILEDAKGDNK